MPDYRTRNRALVVHLLLPTIFLTVTLLGGLRVSAGTGAFLFIAPPLITLIQSVMLMVLMVRGRAVEAAGWLTSAHPPLTNISHALVLITLFFASAQSFNSVLPERGLLRWLLSFFFLWTLWNNQFSSFDARRLLRSLAVLFGTAFVIKHMLLASLYAPEGGWLKRAAGVLLEGVTLGTLDGQAFAPASGYISFFTLALYVCGLVLMPAAPEPANSQEAGSARDIIRDYRRLSERERASVREALERDALLDADDRHAMRRLHGAAGERPDEDDDEKTLINR